MLAINLDTGMSEMSGVLVARKMCCSALGLVAWACGVVGSSSSWWGWMLQIKRPRWSLGWVLLGMRKVARGNQVQNVESEMGTS